MTKDERLAAFQVGLERSADIEKAQQPQSQLRVSEVFGPTIQGEGPSAGRPAAFLRMAACNLSCSWCDTPYTWDWAKYDRTQEIHPMTVMEVVREVMFALPPVPALLVVTGGEPMLQQPRLIQVLHELHRSVPGLEVEVETAGTIVPLAQFSQLVHQFNVSPKLEHSGNALEKRHKPQAIGVLRDTGRAVFKFVVDTVNDLVEVEQYQRAHELNPWDVWIMPLGTTPEELRERMKLLVQPVIYHGWRLTPRLQIDLWGSSRGH